MPLNITGSISAASIRDPKRMSDKALKRLYKPLYPDGLDLTPGSELHERLVNEVMRRAQVSERALKSRWGYWDKTDETLTAFIHLDDVEENVKNRDERKPVSIVVPESFASMETFLTYMVSVFGESTNVRIEGTGPEDVIGGVLLEKVINLQTQKSNLLLEEIPQWRDGFGYGFGVITPGWNVRHGKRTIAEPIIDIDPYTEQPVIVGYNKKRVDAILYEGLKADCIDPRRYLPDPNVSVYKPQDGEYVGWVVQTNYNALKRDESFEGSEFFNCGYLEKCAGVRSSIYNTADTAAREAQGSYAINYQDFNTDGTYPVDVIFMYIDLIPNDWDLGASNEPEKWMVAVASDQVVIACHPMDLDHNKFPVCVCAPDADGHNLVPTSRMEILSGYQLFANYLLNTHIIETDKFLKNRFVANPKKVYIKDILKGRSVIRTRPNAWAGDVKGTFEQVAQTDVTRAHMADLQQIIQMSRQHGGASDALMGVQRQGGPERLTATESNNARGAAVSRMQKLARIISMQSRLPLFEMAIAHTQQFMSQDVYIKTIGEWEQVLRDEYGAGVDRIRVTPFDIDISYDIQISDSSLSGGENAQDWIQWSQTVLANPAAAMQLDWTRINLHIARLMGNKSPEQFMINRRPVRSVVVPDEVALEQAKAGNIVSLENAAQRY